jgi:hypothetical protein
MNITPNSNLTIIFNISNKTDEVLIMNPPNHSISFQNYIECLPGNIFVKGKKNVFSYKKIL